MISRYETPCSQNCRQPRLSTRVPWCAVLQGAAQYSSAVAGRYGKSALDADAPLSVGINTSVDALNAMTLRTGMTWYVRVLVRPTAPSFFAAWVPRFAEPNAGCSAASRAVAHHLTDVCFVGAPFG